MVMEWANPGLAAVNSVVGPVIWRASLLHPMPKVIVPGRVGPVETLGAALAEALGRTVAEALGEGVGEGVSSAMFGAGGMRPDRISPSAMAPTMAPSVPPIVVSEA